MSAVEQPGSAVPQAATPARPPSRLRINPVLVKELRGRMRGWRSFFMLTFYLTVLSGILFFAYLGMRDVAGGLGGPQSSQVGKVLFGSIVIFQMLMVALLTPAFTSGAITQEREQKTYELLVTTLLPSRSIVFGKLGAALAQVVLMIVAVAPLQSMAFMFGGVSPEEIVLSQVVMLLSALFFASAGLFWSSVLRSSVGSNVLTYGTMIFQLAIVPFVYVMATSFAGAFGISSGPTFTTSTGFFYFSGIVLSFHPVIAMVLSETLYLGGDPLFIYTSDRFVNGETVLVISPWLLFCIEMLLLSALLVWLAVRNVGPVRHRRRRVNRET